jgi:HK97 family phage major capsid protein
VEFSSVLPKVPGAGQYACFYGNLRRGMILGDRRQQSIAQSTQYKFAERQLTILGTERIGITVYGQGDATNAGTICALKSKT